MPRITLTLEPELLDQLALHKPKRQSLSAFCADLIEQNLLGLDRASRLPAYRVGAGTQETRDFPAVTAVDPELGRSASSALAVQGLGVVESKIDQTLEPKKQGLLGTQKDHVDLLVDELLVTPKERGTNPKAKGTNPRALGTNPRAKRDPHSKRQIDPALIPDDLLDCQQLLPEFWAVKKGTRSASVWNRVCNKLRQWTPAMRREALERAIASGWGDVFEPPAARPQQGGLPLSPSGTPLTVGEQIAAAAIRNIRAMEERRAAA